MPADPQQTSYQDRLVALKLLRENMFYNDPKKYAYTDLAEDLPGEARAVAPILKNVLPSAAIISHDPAEREQQIDAAIQRIKESKKSKSKLLGEMMHNVTHLAPHAAQAGLALSALTTLLGVRSPFKPNSWRPQLPFAPISAIKKLISTKAHIDPRIPGATWLPREKHIAHLKNTGKSLLHDTLYGGALSAGAGIMIPAFAGNYELSDNALQEAKAIMQKDPYITSLPAGEMLAAIRQRKSEEPITGERRIKNTLLGTGLGALTSIPPAMIPAIMGGVGRLGANALGRLASKFPNVGVTAVNKFLKRHANTNSLSHGVGGTMLNRFKEDLPTALMWGGGIGAGAGALSSNNPVVDEYENLGSN